MNRYLMLAAPVAIVAAAAAMAAAMTPAEYISAAGAGDLYERQSSQLVIDSTNDPALRSFARDMIADHTRSTAIVKAAAAKAHIVVAPPVLTPAQQEMMTQLQAVNGADRDALYIAQQRIAHGQALAVHQGYAAGGTVPSLRTAAAGIVPVVKHHLAMLKMM